MAVPHRICKLLSGHVTLNYYCSPQRAEWKLGKKNIPLEMTSQVITSNPSNPSRKKAGSCCPSKVQQPRTLPFQTTRTPARENRQMTAQYTDAITAGCAGTDLEEYQTARFCKHCWHVFTERNKIAQKFPLT